MGTAIITLLIALLAVFSTISSLKNRNYLGLIFSLATVAIFGFFSIMTIIKSGYPDV